MRRSLQGLALLLLTACASTTITRGNPNAAPNSAASAENHTFVCHGKNNPQWKKVATNAVDAHRRHGDRVVTTPQRENTDCTQ